MFFYYRFAKTIDFQIVKKNPIRRKLISIQLGNNRTYFRREHLKGAKKLIMRKQKDGNKIMNEKEEPYQFGYKVLRLT